MRGRLLNLLTALSVLLCAAAVAGRLFLREHSLCFSASLPGGRLIVVNADDRLRLALWRDWPAWEWPATRFHERRSDFDYCGPLTSLTGRDGTSYRSYDLVPGVRRHDATASYGLDGNGMPGWPERRAFAPPPAGPAASSAAAPAPASPGLTSYRRLDVPFELAAATAAALPVLRAGRAATRSIRRRRRRRSGHCARCGYDLRASPDKCPECGAAASVSTGG